MPIVLADSYADNMVDIILNDAGSPANWVYHLYVNDLTPTPATVLGDFTEATETGYAPENVPSSGWTPTTSPSGTTVAINSSFLWTISISGTFHGLYVTGAGGVLAWSERFGDPIVFGSLGGSIEVIPTLAIKSPIA